jgi:hypothetical protein
LPVIAVQRNSDCNRRRRVRVTDVPRCP